MERGYLRAHTQRVVPQYLARRDALEGALRKALPPGCHWTRPTPGVVLWLQLPPPLDVEVAYEEALRHGVLTSPGSMWSIEAEPQRGLRLTFCSEPPERLAEGAKRLGKALRTMIARAPDKARTETRMEVV